MTVHYLNHIKEYNAVNYGDVSVYTNDHFAVIGPLRKKDGFCLSCFQSRMKEMKLRDTHFFEATNKKLTSFEMEQVENYSAELQKKQDDNLLYMLNRQTQEVELMGTFKRGDCNICNTDKATEPVRSDSLGSKKFDFLNPRQETWENVKRKIEKHKHFLYDNPLSIINRINRSGDSYGIPMVETEVSMKGISLLSYGRTRTYEKSRYTSILESLERYATAFPYQISTHQWKETESDEADLTLSDVIEINNLEMGEYTKDETVYYRKVDALHKNEKAFIPEQLIYFDSHHISGEKRYVFDSSNGSALGSTLEEASLYAMLELFERDAFLSTWYGQIAPVRIGEDALQSPTVQSYLLALKRKGIKVHLFDISLELKIPTIWVLLEKMDAEKTDMAFYTAAATSFDLDDAIEKALIEATTAISVFTNVFKSEEAQQRKQLLLDDPTKVSKLEDHLLLYSNREAAKFLSFALETPYEMTKAELDAYYTKFDQSYSEILSYFHQILLGNSQKAYRAKTENPNLEKIGFVNVKYIVPEMLTMTFGHQNRRVVHSRIEKALKTKGRGKLDKQWIDLVPHPFP